MQIFVAVTSFSVPMKGWSKTKQNTHQVLLSLLFTHSCPSSTGIFSKSLFHKQQLECCRFHLSGLTYLVEVLVTVDREGGELYSRQLAASELGELPDR